MNKRENKNFENTKKTALSGIITALCVVIMYVGSASGIGDLLAVSVSALLIVFAVIETGGIFPWLIWAVTGVICFFFLPDKYSALEFILFGGIYPMIKSRLERFPPFIAYAMKLLYFNLAFTASILIAKYLLTSIDIGFEVKIVSYIFANVFFIISDVWLSLMISVYMAKIRPKIKRSK